MTRFRIPRPLAATVAAVAVLVLFKAEAVAVVALLAVAVALTPVATVAVLVFAIAITPVRPSTAEAAATVDTIRAPCAGCLRRAAGWASAAARRAMRAATRSSALTGVAVRFVRRVFTVRFVVISELPSCGGISAIR